MKRITKNLLFYWKYWGIVMFLLGIQLFCLVGISLGLDQIKRTGGENEGLQYMVAKSLPKNTWEWTALYMTAAEKAQWTECYELGSDNCYHLKDSYMDSANLASMENTFLEVQGVVQYLSEMKDGELEDLLEEHGDYFTTDYLDVRDIVAEEVESKKETSLYACARTYVIEASGQAGINLTSNKKLYIAGRIFWMVFRLIIVIGTVIFIGRYQKQLLLWIGNRIQETEVARAEKTLYCFLIGIVQSAAWYYAALWELRELSRSQRTVKLALIILVVLMLAVLLIRKLNVTEGFNQAFGYQGNMQRKWLNWFTNGITAGLPISGLLLGATILLHRSLPAMLMMLFADFVLVIIAFLFADLLAAVDGVDKIEKNAIVGEEVE